MRMVLEGILLSKFISTFVNNDGVVVPYYCARFDCGGIIHFGSCGKALDNVLEGEYIRFEADITPKLNNGCIAFRRFKRL